MVEDKDTGILFVDPSMVEMIPVGDLKIYKRNAKKHTQEQIEQIINSIKAFGMNDPIGIWGKDNVIVEGHGSFLALREMGETGEVPCIRLDHLTDEQRRAYALAHNKLTMNTDFDDAMLLPELEALEDIYDMSDFGFDAENADFDYDVDEKKDSEFKEKKEQFTICPNCGMHFVPILTSEEE